MDSARFGFCFVVAGYVAWCGKVSGMPKGVCEFQMFDFVLGFLRKVFICCAGVCEMGVSCAVFRENVS